MWGRVPRGSSSIQKLPLRRFLSRRLSPAESNYDEGHQPRAASGGAGIRGGEALPSGVYPDGKTPQPLLLKDPEAPSHHSSRRWRSRSQSLQNHLRRCHKALGETCTPLARHVSVFLVFFPHLVDPFLFLSSWQADPDNQPAQYRPACLNCLAACHSLVLEPHSPSLDKLLVHTEPEGVSTLPLCPHPPYPQLLLLEPL